jgi:hypothetical protein
MTETTELAPNDDIQLDVTTRQQRLKWTIVVDEKLPIGLIANAVACMSAAVGQNRPDLLGPAGTDASGITHQALPWTGCSILATDVATLHELRTKALTKEGLVVLDMPQIAQESTAYADYLDTLPHTSHEDMTYYAVGFIGARNKVDKLVGRLSLLR